MRHQERAEAGSSEGASATSGTETPFTIELEMSATGIAAPLLCAGDPGVLVAEADAKELAEGFTMVKGEIGCVAFKSGLVCVNSKGRGFFLSRASARYF